MKYIFIINPISGGSSKAKLIQNLNEFCFYNKLTYEIRYTEYPAHAKIIAAEYAHDAENIIVAVGGDGTVNEVASSLVGEAASLYVIPTGSGNGFARHNKIPLNLASNLKKMLLSKSHKMTDVCYLNDTPFFNVSGLGFDAFISIKFSELSGRGFANYVKAVISNFKKYSMLEYTVSLNDGTTFSSEAFFISFANTSQFGNDAHIAPDADNTDGLIDIVIAPKPKPSQFATIALSLFSKKKIKGVKYLKAQNISIQCSGTYAHIDGEPIHDTFKNIELRIEKQKLKILS